MPRRTKRPWNADLVIPGLDGTPPSPPPKPLPGRVIVGHSTAHFMPEPERWHVVEVLAGGTRVTLMLGAHPWVGSERSATVEAQRLTRETGRPHEAVPAESAQPAPGRAR